MAKTALVLTTTASQIDCSQMSAITGLAIVSTEPANTTTKYAIKTAAGTWKKWNTTSSAWENVATQALTADSVLSEGNTRAELLAVPVASLQWLAGSKIDTGVAFSMTDAATEPPSLTSITINGTTGATVYEKIITSDSIALASADAAVDILDIQVEKTEVAGGTVAVLASIQGNDNAWSTFKSYDSYVTTPATKAKAIKLQAVLTAPTINVSQAALASVSVKHRTDNVAVFAEGTGSCVTKTYNFIREMQRAHLMVKRPVVPDTEVKAYISLRPKPVSVTQEVLGVGDGTQHTYTLKHPTNVAAHTFALYFNGTKQTAGFAFSSTDGKVTCTAPIGASVTSDYDYNWLPEQFVAMVYDAQYPDALNSEMVNDQFDYVAVATSDPRGSVSAIRIDLIQKKGTVTAEAVGTGSGALQSYQLDHKAKIETLVIKAAGSPLAQENWTYKDKTNTLFVTAANGAAITADYDWAADPVYLDNFACVWNE